MASVQHHMDAAEFVIHEILTRRKEYQTLDCERHFAVLTIQKWWRGYSVRKMIKHWNACATLIQKWFRGWYVRWRLPIILKEYLDIIRMRHYDTMATKIQALWRGYRSRKKINVKKMIAQRKTLQALNDRFMQLMKKSFDNLRKEQQMQEFTEKKRNVINILENMHHLLRSKQVPGVFSIAESEELSDIEKLIKYLSWKKIQSTKRIKYKR